MLEREIAQYGSWFENSRVIKGEKKKLVPEKFVLNLFFKDRRKKFYSRLLKLLSLSLLSASQHRR